MRLIRSAMLLAGTVSFLVVGACDAGKGTGSAAQAPSEPAAVTVNGTAISKRVVDRIVAQGAGAGRPDTPESRKAIVEQLALQAVIAQEAIKKGLDKSPELVEQLDLMKQSALANAYVQDFIKSNPVTDDMLKAEYERIKATVSGTEYKARHILVEKEAEAKEIVARLRKTPGAFEKLAAERSKDQGSKARGGDLGWFDARRMVPEFAAALGKLEKGKFTIEPVKSQFGYHVILLEDSRPIQAPPLEEVKTQISQQLQQQGVKKQLDALKAQAKIEVAGAPAAAASTPASAAAK